MDAGNALAKAWAVWKRIGSAIGDLIGRFVLMVFYFTIFMPFALGFRVFRREVPRADAPDGHWIRREFEQDDLTKAKRLS